MFVKQISVFLENKSGRLAEVTRVLAEEDINIFALSISDTTDFGILRLIVNDPAKAETALKNRGFTVKSTNVLAISVEDKPGGLYKALKVLDEANIGIEYMYAFVSREKDNAMVIIRVEQYIEATELLDKNGIRVLSSDMVYKMQ